MPRKKTLVPLTFTEPMECKAVTKLPTGPDWTYEVKLDGYRASIAGRGHAPHPQQERYDLTSRFPATAAALKAGIPIGTAVDGELAGYNE